MTIPSIASYPMPQTSAIPEQRVDWRPDAKRAVLLIHDMQDYFIDFFEAHAAPIPDLIRNILSLRDLCDRAGVPVIYTAQPTIQTRLQRGLLQEWWGPGITARPERSSVVAALLPRAGDIVLDKWRYSAFTKSDLLGRLQTGGRDQLFITGVYAHIGCMLTAAEAFMNDIQPFMIADAVADFSAQQHLMALDYIAQRCGIVTTTARLGACLQVHPQRPASLDALRKEITTFLGLMPGQLNDSDNLLYKGMDSIRLMTLVEKWRQPELPLTFTELASQPTLMQWHALLHKNHGV